MAGQDFRPLVRLPESIGPLQVFTVLWGCQALIHQDYFQPWTDGRPPTGWLVTLLAVLCVVRPAIGSLLALSVVSLIYNVQRWPEVPNHILVEGLFNFTIAVAIVWALVERGHDPDRRTPGATIDPARILDRFTPVLLVGTVVMYWFAALAKLNRGFFDTAASCGVDLYGDLRSRLPMLPDGEWTGSWVIVATIIIEVAIPLAFTFRRTRFLGLAIGLPFHFVLGLIGYRTFAAFVYAVYFLFFAERITAGAAHLWAEWRPRISDRQLLTAQGGFGAGVVVYFLLSAQGWGDQGVGPFELLHIGWLAWIVYSLAIIGLYGYSLLRDGFSISNIVAVSDRERQVHPGWLWAIAILTVLNGSAQYVGFKTETAFTMYSNLSTEAGEWNHVVVPELFEFDGATEDIVVIESTDHPELAELQEAGFVLTWFEFRRIVNDTEEPFRVTYRRGGERHSFDTADPASVASAGVDPLNAIIERLRFFRPIPASGAIPCLH